MPAFWPDGRAVIQTAPIASATSAGADRRNVLRDIVLSRNVK
jgi:hypothetical protein